ncbi:unnamed protein product [Trichogramma brassicae]|uniref:Uncharacterized protein n=1 Tax=Trichogramma brassicae TaxID=86971 RepID=A0A6H5IKW9_9HYME|nr:unnamed protein product [Trichogramma brassicae]
MDCVGSARSPRRRRRRATPRPARGARVNGGSRRELLNTKNSWLELGHLSRIGLTGFPLSLYHVYRRALTLSRGQCVWTCTNIVATFGFTKKKKGRGLRDRSTSGGFVCVASARRPRRRRATPRPARGARVNGGSRRELLNTKNSWLELGHLSRIGLTGFPLSLYHVYRRALTLSRGQCVWTCTTIGVRLSALRKKCEDCQLRQVMRMNLYDDRCATFGITEKVRGLPGTASDAYELVRLSVCDFRHYGKSARTASYGKCEDCQLRQVMRMNSYDYRCATFGITEKVRGLPVTASDAYELVRRSCEDCQLRQVMRMNSYDYRCVRLSALRKKVRGLPVTASDAYELVRRSVCDFRHYGKSARTASTAGDAYELVRRSCVTFGLTKKVRGLREMSSDAYELVRV